MSCATTGQVWLKPGDGTAILWHEIGHAVEHQLLDEVPTSRAWFTAMFGFAPGTPWFAGFQERAPGELFAEAYARCQLGWTPPRTIIRTHRRGGMTISREIHRGKPAGYGYTPTVRQHRAICNSVAVLEIL
jgi:hypothetical protein